jgi:XapX domain-containing protein
MLAVIYSVVTGFIVGGIFTLFKFPIPAPQSFQGIAGIVGVWLGFVTLKNLLGR